MWSSDEAAPEPVSPVKRIKIKDWETWEPVFEAAKKSHDADYRSREELEMLISKEEPNHKDDNIWQFTLFGPRKRNRVLVTVATNVATTRQAFVVILACRRSNIHRTTVTTRTTLAHDKRTNCGAWKKYSSLGSKQIKQCCTTLCEDVPTCGPLSEEDELLRKLKERRREHGKSPAKPDNSIMIKNWDGWDPVFKRIKKLHDINCHPREELEMLIMEDELLHEHGTGWLFIHGPQDSLRVTLAIDEGATRQTFVILACVHSTDDDGQATITTRTTLAHDKHTKCGAWRTYSELGQKLKLTPCCDTLCEDVPADGPLCQEDKRLKQLKENRGRGESPANSSTKQVPRGTKTRQQVADAWSDTKLLMEQLINENDQLAEKRDDLVSKNKHLQWQMNSLKSKLHKAERKIDELQKTASTNAKGGKKRANLSDGEEGSYEDTIARALKRTRLA
ncbi:hypothetical protein HJFPF1_08693 [Paramyrothecium foliicola]|nr:hypothetical protein HJFPF1_08693 [Paramyrothecium foliicola]